MDKSIIIVVAILVLSCNSENNKPKSKIVKQKSKIEIKPSENIVIEKSQGIIYDTLVFTENMKGEILNEKFKSAQIKLEFYKKFINPKNINVLKTITDKHTKTEIKYLGIIKDLNENNSYHVITNFQIYGIGQMLSPRGKSEVTFINKKNNQIVIYDLPMPYFLPKYIEENILYFDIEETKIGISVFGGLAPKLCIPKIGCY
ncbi:hypothetical protein [Chryseobacterium sp. RLHN22]|uniref:hypothetical protein n=1 Tax=Chryseobacterium sp. RLHN22 TaxID=3437885 RepID=UPI003D9BB60B